MANNVHFNISIETNSEDKLKEVLDFAETDNGEMKWKTWEAHLFPIYPEPYTDEGWYAWGCDNMGAKWGCIEEADTNQIAGYSAWSPPVPMINHLAKFLGNGTSIKMTYEDEFRNFVGVCEVWIAGDDVDWDFYEAEGSEFIDCMEEWSGWKTDDPDFEWWEVKLVQGGGHYEPQEVIDDMVYGFFEDQKVMVRHD